MRKTKPRLLPPLPYLSFERDPPEIRRQSLDPAWQQSLSFMQGKSLAGLRAVQVDSAGQQLARGIDLADCSLVAESTISDDYTWQILPEIFDFIFYSYVLRSASAAESFLKLQVKTGTIFSVPFKVRFFSFGGAWHEGGSDTVWCKADKIQIFPAVIWLRFSYTAYKLPER